MAPLKYTVIKTKKQYFEYCNTLEKLVDGKPTDKDKVDEVDLLTLLIEKWDADHNTVNDVDPIQLLRSFMDDHNLHAKHLAELLGISKGYVSDILNYKKGLSKDVIRKLAKYFKVYHEAFNRPYKLRTSKKHTTGKSKGRNKIRA